MVVFDVLHFRLKNVFFFYSEKRITETKGTVVNNSDDDCAADVNVYKYIYFFPVSVLFYFFNQ